MRYDRARTHTHARTHARTHTHTHTHTHDFCGFWSVAGYAILLSKLWNVPLCNYRTYLSSFSILKIAAVLSNKIVENYQFNFTSGSGDHYASYLPNFIKIGRTLAELVSKRIWLRWHNVRTTARTPKDIKYDLTFFKMAAGRRLGFLTFIFNGRSGQQTYFASPYQIS